ncbi:unnamed protein product [Closterium sp. NIES-53]
MFPSLDSVEKKLGKVGKEERFPLHPYIPVTPSSLVPNHPCAPRLGVEDKLGAEKLMFAALDSVEKKLGKALVGDDVKGMAMFQEEVNAINKKLGLKDGDLEPLEQQLETSMAKTDIAAFASEATQKIGTYQKRDGLEDIQVDLRTLDPKAYM